MHESTEKGWDIRVNGKYIGRAPIDPNWGLESAQAHIKAALAKGVIKKDDLSFPNVTQYLVVDSSAPMLPITGKKKRGRA